MNVQSKSVTVQLFDDCFPAAWSIQVLTALDALWRESREYCRSMKFGVDEGHDLVSHHIRARFETELRRISEAFGINAESCKNRLRTASHTCIKAKSPNGDSMILTASAVRSCREKPRRADFRHVYNENGQLSLWDDQPEVEDKATYGVILYGAPQAHTPSFVTIAFPSIHWKKYVDYIDLTARYPGVVSTSVLEEIEISAPSVQPIHIAPEEDIQKDQKPRIRPRRKSVGEE
jgi:hypothetical protein